MKKHFWDNWSDIVWMTLIVMIGFVIITAICSFS